MRWILVLVVTACAARPATQTTPKPAAPRETLEGFIPIQWDAEKGRAHLRVERFDEDFLYQVSLSGGLGSNPVGLDRGLLGGTRLVRFERHGDRVLLVVRPTRFRVVGGDEAQRRTLDESFASSVLWGFEVESSDAHGVVVDATDFFLSDVFGVVGVLSTTEQGSYRVDATRSAIERSRTRAFPRNTEIDALITFTTDGRPGPLVSAVTPVPSSVTLHEHHSFLALPPDGFTTRRPDPRVGVYALEVYDYASPFTAPLERRTVMRHRMTEGKPLVYYVDSGAPQPIRDALVEGASWWREAFAAAGFPDGFRVEVLPPDVDPMDARYNVIHWVHRATRGWSFGQTAIDPRTGEIIRGVVLLGSQRIRQDVLIARGLIPQYDEAGAQLQGELDATTSPSQMALARVRQLAAHEVGHTLGLDHNMAASAAGRASVMDYPAPQVKITGGKLDLSDAYAKGIGAYDKIAIRFAYSADDAAAVAAAGEAPLFIKDEDSRPVSAAHPLGSVWDGGDDPVAMLRHEVEVRRIALDGFGLKNLAAGEALSSLEEKLLPLYLHHRYQVEAAAKSIGGVTYGYAVKTGAAISPPELRRVVPAARQRDALAAVVATLEAGFLLLPQRIVDLIPPRAYGTEEGVAERFPANTTPLFDPVAAAASAADLTLAALLDGERAARLMQLHAEDPANPDFFAVTDAVLDVVMARTTGRAAAITRATRALFAGRLMGLAATHPDSEVRAAAGEALRNLSARCAAAAPGRDRAEAAHRRSTRDEIERFLSRPAATVTPPAPPDAPAGPPI